MTANAANLKTAVWEAAHALPGSVLEIRWADIDEWLRGAKGGR